MTERCVVMYFLKDFFKFSVWRVNKDADTQLLRFDTHLFFRFIFFLLPKSNFIICLQGIDTVEFWRRFEVTVLSEGNRVAPLTFGTIAGLLVCMCVPLLHP